MSRTTVALVSLFVFAGLVAALAPPSQAAPVSVNLYALNVQWHVGSASSTQTTITVHVNDTLQLRIENDDTVMHTFTAPHFPSVTGQGGTGTTLNLTLAAGQVRFWNYTVTASDLGSWQFYCSVPGHSTGTYPNRVGMVGAIAVQTSGGGAPAAGSNLTLIIGGVIIVVAIIAVVAAVAMRRKPKPPASP